MRVQSKTYPTLWYEVEKKNGKVEVTNEGTLPDEISMEIIRIMEDYPTIHVKREHILGVIEFLEEWYSDSLIAGTIDDVLEEAINEYFCGLDAKRRETDEEHGWTDRGWR